MKKIFGRILAAVAVDLANAGKLVVVVFSENYYNQKDMIPATRNVIIEAVHGK